jgi:hypothetical protein
MFPAAVVELEEDLLGWVAPQLGRLETTADSIYTI